MENIWLAVNEMGAKMRNLHILLLTLYFLVGCTSVAIPSEATTTQSEVITRPNPTLISIPTQAILSQTTSTINSMPPQDTATPILPTETIVPTYDPIIGLSYHCLTTLTEIPARYIFSGRLILAKDIGEFFALDIDRGILEPFLQENPNPMSNWFEISPNAKRFVYFEPENNYYTVSNHEEIEATFPYRPEWRIIRWLDNERWVISHDRKPYNSIFIVNPFTQEEREIVLDLPNPYYQDTFDKTLILISAIDQSLTRLVYFDTQENGRVILWDLEKQQILAWLPYPVPTDQSTDPMNNISGSYLSGWSPDGSQFVTNSPVSPTAEELFSIAKDGQVTQLTQLSLKYPIVRIANMSNLSPDGRYIAFWLQVSEQVDQSLDDITMRFVILDTKTKELTDYCLPPVYPYTREPVWLATSQHLFVQIDKRDKNQLTTNLNVLEQDQILFIDLKNNLSFPIINQYNLQGWISNP